VTVGAPEAAAATSPHRRLALVDCDVHPVMTPAHREQRLAAKWRRRLEEYGSRSVPLGTLYPRAANAGWRLDARPPDGVIGGDPDFAREQLLDTFGIEYAVLNPSTMLSFHEGADLAAALAVAVNDWLDQVWLASDSRYLGAITVPIEYPDVAAREIERCVSSGGRWVQIIVPAGTQEPLGSDKYRPIFRVAAECGLPVAAHFGGVDDHSGAGWPSYYIEEHVAYAVRVQAQVANLICSGIFGELPELRFVLTEFGFAWLVGFRWALDRAWERFGAELEHLDRPPSEILHDHFWMTTQPVDEPDDPQRLVQMIEHGRLADRLLFATDYPHWDFDSPRQALPRSLPPELQDAIFAGNACRLHRLPRESTELT
jgi:predicted TIM-barrel fold metal-dependent hydrolase